MYIYIYIYSPSNELSYRGSKIDCINWIGRVDCDLPLSSGESPAYDGDCYVRAKQ